MYVSDRLDSFSEIFSIWCGGLHTEAGGGFAVFL